MNNTERCEATDRVVPASLTRTQDGRVYCPECGKLTKPTTAWQLFPPHNGL